MPATVIIEEFFEAGTPESYVKDAQRLRIKAGAIRCTYSGSVEDGWAMETELNVIGENDDDQHVEDAEDQNTEDEDADDEAAEAD